MCFIEQVKTTCGHLFFLIRLQNPQYMSYAAFDSFISSTSDIWDTGFVVSCALGEGGNPDPIFFDKIPQGTNSILQLQTTWLIMNSEARGSRVISVCFTLLTLQAHPHGLWLLSAEFDSSGITSAQTEPLLEIAPDVRSPGAW